MRKEYEKPTVTVVKLEIRQSILAECKTTTSDSGPDVTCIVVTTPCSGTVS
jgi:hypothetical protein